MIRLLLILILLIPNVVFSKSIWSRISDCVSNPCTCHCSPDKITEYWPSVTTVTKEGVTTSTRTLHQYKNYCHCPPYRKTKGRAGCLKQFDVPSGGCVSNLCAEYPGVSLSSYFNPHIRIRGQFCNVASCWTKTATLRYSGECLNWAGPYGLPLKRVCARIALSGDSKSNGLDDDGYTPKKHLDFEGHDQPDEIMYDDNGTQIEYNPPKLCAYIDPSIFQPEGKLDLLDINPKNEPFQTGSGLSPIAQILISISDAGMSIASVLPIILNKMDVPQSAVNAIKSIMNFNEGVLVSMLKEFGQLNKTVSSRLGCVQIALGPFPPPFCNPLVLTTGRPSIEQICPTVTSDTSLCNGTNNVCLQNDPTNPTKCVLCRLSSTDDSPCVDSAITNNAIQNTLRIGFNKITPVCSSAGSYTTDQCVNLSILSASIAHNTYSDLIPPSLIVNSPALTPGAGQTGFRAVYGTMMSGSVELSGSYNPSLPDCVSVSILNSTQCQTIYGINAGNFVDLSITFPSIETTYNPYTLVATTPAILDPSGMMRTFTAAITRVEELDPNDTNAKSLGITALADPSDPTSVTSPTQTTNQICVFDVTNISSPVAVGCVDRAPAPKPLVSSCNGYSTVIAGSVSVSCPANDNNNPAVVASLTVGSNTTAGALYIPSNNLQYSPTQLNLASNDYTAFVTDNNYNVSPFFTKSPTTSPVTNYLYGTYMDSAGNITSTPPYNSDGSNNTNVKYLYGLEYQDGLYTAGAGNQYTSPAYKLFTCVEPSSVTPCPENIQNCVLTNLQSNNIVDCDTFNTLADTTYTPLRKCSSADTLCWSSPNTSCTAGSCPVLKQSSSCKSTDCTYITSLATLPTATGGSVTIYSCPANSSTGDSASYCYYHSTMENICQITSDIANRIVPDPSAGDTLTDSQYYNYVAPTASTSNITTNPDTLSCSSYLSGLETQPYSSNIMPCDASYTSCSVIEYFSSPNPSQILTMKNCTNSNGSQVQCYSQSNSSGICQLSNLLTIRYASNPSASNPTVSKNATTSSVVANKLLASGSSVSCQEFLGAIDGSYNNIQLCTSAQTVSACPIIDIVSSTNPATSVNVQQCTKSQTSNCYVNPTGLPINMNSLSAAYPNYTAMCDADMTNKSCNVISDLTSTLGVILQQCTEVTTNYCYSTANSSCNLGCSGAQEGLQSKSCSDFISLMNVPSSSDLYGDIPVCSNDASCPNNAALTITYGSGAVCAASTPICNNVETVINGGASLFTIKSCTSSGYNVTYNSVTTPVSGPNNYYCYTPTNSSCNVSINQSVVRTSSSGSTLPNPTTISTPKICDVVNSTTTPTPPNTTPCSATNLNPSLCAIRTKTAIERGLCSDLMPYPKCNAKSQNNISWSATDVGQKASGTCLNGTVSSNLAGTPPSSYCLADLNQNTATASWGPITDSCIPACGAAIINGSSFSTTLPGKSTTGTCDIGYVKASNGNSPTAVCINNSGTSSTFGNITDPCQISNCNGATINGAIIATTAPGTTSTAGSCQTGFTQNPAGPPKAYCRGNSGATSTFDAVQNPCLVQGCAGGYNSILNATLPDTPAGQTSVATCARGYKILGSTPPSAQCVARAGYAPSYNNYTNPCTRVQCTGTNDTSGSANWSNITADAFDASQNKWVVAWCVNSDWHARCASPDIYPRRQCILSADGQSASWGDAAAPCKKHDMGDDCATELQIRRLYNILCAPNTSCP